MTDKSADDTEEDIAEEALKRVSKGGRPPALVRDDATLKIMGGLGRISATTKEAAAVFGVAESTFMKFLSETPSAREVFDAGKEVVKTSLRRAQLKLALGGNATMLIWLGKQLLGQVDKSEVEHSGGIDVSYAGQRVRDKVSALIADRATEGVPPVH